MASPNLGDLDDAFTKKERERLRRCTEALRTSYIDFIHFATMQAIDEMEGIAEDYRNNREFWDATR